MTSKVYTVGDRYGRERTVIASGLDVIAKCDALLVETEADGTTSSYAAMIWEGSRAAPRRPHAGAMRKLTTRQARLSRLRKTHAGRAPPQAYTL